MTAPAGPARRRDAAAGVTLVEVLVALALFALIGTAAFAVLDQVIRVQNQTEGRLQRLAEVQRAMHVVAQDFMQASGDSLGVAAGAVSFRRSAGDGEMAVRYALDATTLVRSVAGADGADPARQALLAGVSAIDWRFLDPDAGWRATWPPESVAESPGNPAAVALELVLGGTAPSGVLRRIAILPADAGR